MGSTSEDFVDFLNKSCTHFHATVECCKALEAAGFQRLHECDSWALKPEGKYFLTRNGSSVVAFVLGGGFAAGHGFNVVAAHTDSPCLKLKPISAASAGGFLKVGVQTYGGGLWHTWFDRDLSVAGRVLVRRDGVVSPELVRIDRPILRIPTLAIHLDRTVNTEGFKPNAETHLAPILATSIKAALTGEAEKDDGEHHPLLLKLLADELKCSPEDIVDFELNVCDTQPSAIGGAKEEFIFSGRLDNLCSVYTALKALLKSTEDVEAVRKEERGWMVAFFDNEEIGSATAQGAASPMMFEAMRRATFATDKDGREGVAERMIQDSFLVSADMAHALHPNYMERHEAKHQPKLHKGLVIKHNANQRYATTSVTSFLFKETAPSLPTQNFCVRNDCGCGSTIGPIVASGIGVRCVDVGVPQLSMHSVREMCGTDDVQIALDHFHNFFLRITAVDKALVV